MNETTNASRQSGSHKNMLGQRKVITLSKWLMTHEQIVKAARTVEELAALASTELGFLVTWSNIKSVCKDSGIDYPRQQCRKGEGDRGRLQRIEKLEELVLSLCLAMRYTYGSRGQTLPPVLQDAIEGKWIKKDMLND